MNPRCLMSYFEAMASKKCLRWSRALGWDVEHGLGLKATTNLAPSSITCMG
jgi:hypothetical protein